MLSIIRPITRSSLMRPSVFARQFKPMIPSVRYNSTNFTINTQSHVFKYLNEGPKYLKFTEEHEWLAVHEDDTGFVGITTYAAEALGDATFIELPEVGTTVDIGENIGSVESVKSASEIYSPVHGEIIAVNDILESKPQLINDDPMGNGWIAQIKLLEPTTVESSKELMDSEQYEDSLKDE